MLNVRMNSVNEAQIHTEELDERTVCICVYIYIYFDKKIGCTNA